MSVKVAVLVLMVLLYFLVKYMRELTKGVSLGAVRDAWMG
jgi:hypothetical protein